MEDEQYERDFKGIWIPKEIWLDDRLNALDKIILVEIDSLDSSEDGCYASNNYLAKFCQCTETKISTSIKKLIELRYLETLKFDGRKRYLKSRLKENERQTLKNLKADFKKFKDINIYNNIINNNSSSIYDFLQENGFVLAPIHYEIIEQWEDNELTRYAIKQAVMNNKYNIKYVQSILNNYEKENIRTIQQAKEQEEQYNSKKKYKKEINEPKWFNEEHKIENITKEDKEEIENILKEIGE